MKKFRYLLSMLALALVVAGASKALPASATEDTGKAAALTAAVNYASEIVNVTGAVDAVYYQVVKDSTVATLKANAWLPAAKTATNTFGIDVSGFTKSGFVAYTTENTVTDAKDFKVIAVLAPVKTLKLTLDFKKDVPANLYDALAFANAVNVDAAVNATYNLGGTLEKKDDLGTFLGVYTLAWKRGANGTWAEADQEALDTVDAAFQKAYTMLRSSNSTLYVRVVEAKTGDADKAAVLPSKEVKVKVPKTAAAPNVKVNYQTGIVPFKNGQEFKYDDYTFYVPVYDKNASGTAKISGDKNATTKTKVTGLTLGEIVAAINAKLEDEEETLIAAGAAFSIDYRTTATAKKYASWYATFNFKNEAVAPAPKTGKAFAYNTNSAKHTIEVDFTQINAVEGKVLEYAVSGVDVDVTTLKWTKVEDPTKVVDLSKFSGKDIKYKNAAKEAKTVKYEAATVYFRYAANVDKADPSKNDFPSAYNTMVGTAAAVVKLTFTADPADKIAIKDEGGVKITAPVDATKDEAYKFTVTCSDATLKVITVKAGETTLTPTDGVYTVTPTADTAITVKATKEQVTLTFNVVTGATVTFTAPVTGNLTGTTKDFDKDADVKFTVAYDGTYVVKVGSDAIEATAGVYTVKADAAKTIKVEAVE